MSIHVPSPWKTSTPARRSGAATPCDAVGTRHQSGDEGGDGDDPHGGSLRGSCERSVRVSRGSLESGVDVICDMIEPWGRSASASTSAGRSRTSCSSAPTARSGRRRSSPRPPTTREGVIAGVRRLQRDAEVSPADDQRRGARDHRRVERRPRASRRDRGARDDRGLSRRPRDAPAADPGALRPAVREAGAARAPRASLRGARAPRPARRGLGRARREHRSGRRGAALGAASRGGGDRAAPLVRRRRPRAPGRGDPARERRRRRLRDAVGRHPSRGPRVRAHEHRRRQRVPRPRRRQVHRLAHEPPARRGDRRSARDHAVERRHASARDRGAEAGAPRRVGPCSGCHRVQPARSPHGPAEPDLAGHGRHHGKGRAPGGRPARAHERVRGRCGDQPQQQAGQGRRPRHQAPVHRRVGDRSGRWQHRGGRPAGRRPRRPGERRLGPRPGLLRDGWHTRDAHRRARRARPSEPRAARRRRRPSRRARRPERDHRAGRDPARHVTDRGGARSPHDRGRDDDAGREGRHDVPRPGPAGLRDLRVRRQRPARRSRAGARAPGRDRRGPPFPRCLQRPRAALRRQRA